MKIKKFIISAVTTAVLLTGCGSGSSTYDFSDKDLSHAILTKESVLDEASQQPTEKNVIKQFSNIDEYKYVFERSGDSKEILHLITKDDVVTKIQLGRPVMQIPNTTFSGYTQVTADHQQKLSENPFSAKTEHGQKPQGSNPFLSARRRVTRDL